MSENGKKCPSLLPKCSLPVVLLCFLSECQPRTFKDDGSANRKAAKPLPKQNVFWQMWYELKIQPGKIGTRQKTTGKDYCHGRRVKN